jgi:tetratricopeptide (TPR) repeat protein
MPDSLADPPFRFGAWLMLVITAIVYFPALRGRFVWDDIGFVVGNKLLDAPNPLYVHWLTTQPLDYWPMTYTVLWVMRQFFGLQVVPYHLLNVFLHAACATLIWRIARRLQLRAPWLIGVLFLVHPLNVQAVAWVFQVKTLLAGVFFFASVLCFIDADQSAPRSRRHHAAYMASVALFAAAMLSKSSPVMLPVVLLVYSWWSHHRLTLADLLRSIPFFIVSFMFGLVGLFFQHKNILPDAHIEPFTLATRLGQIGQIAWFYLYKTAVPISLLPIYPKWPVQNVTFAFFLPIFLLAVFMGALASMVNRRHPAARASLALLAYFFLMLLPVLGVARIVFFYVAWVADHYVYLALPAIIALIVQAAAMLADAFALPRRGAVVLAGGVVTLLALLSFHQTFYWRNNLDLWRHQVAVAPLEWQGQESLAAELSREGRFDDALPHALAAVHLAPQHGGPHAQLGMIFRATGDRAAALDQYTLATQCRPPVVEAYVSLAQMAQQSGNHAAEERLDHQALDVAHSYYHWPGFAPAENDLGQICFARGDVASAIALYSNALKEEPNMTEAHVNLGIALMAQHRFAEAIPQFRQALQERPELRQAELLLSEALAAQRE